MTLVSAFRQLGVPMLVGDFLISSPADGLPHTYIPTNPAFNTSKPESGYRVSGMRRKLSIIAPNLCVGWAGNRIAARAVFRELTENAALVSANIESIRSLLLSIQDLSTMPVDIVGWVIHGDAVAFKWSSEFPSEFYAGSDFTIGSGSILFSDLMKENPSAHSASLASQELAIFKTLAKSALFLAKETGSAATLRNFCGYGLEIVALGPAGFSFLESMTYLNFLLRVGLDERIRSFPHRIMYKYQGQKDYALVQVVQSSENPGANTGKAFPLKSENTFVSLIEPVFPDVSVPRDKWMHRLSMQSRFYCLHLSVEIQGAGYGSVALVIDGNDLGDFRHYKRDEMDYFEFSVDMVRPAIDKLLTQMTFEP